MRIYLTIQNLSVILLIFFIFTVHLDAQDNSNEVIPEIIEWSAIAATSGVEIYIRFQDPFFEKTLMNSPYTNLSYKENSVSTLWIVAVDAAALASIAFIPNTGGGQSSEETSYKNIKGFLETVAVTNLITDFSKNVVGRKRPDYDDRVSLKVDIPEGRQSFWSGHASNAFATATYMSLFTVEHLGEKDNYLLKVSLPLVLYGAASFVGWTRIDDNRHFVDDVIVGSIVGTLTAGFFYGVQNYLGK